MSTAHLLLFYDSRSLFFSSLFFFNFCNTFVLLCAIMYLYINQIVPGGVAARSGKLRMGDRLVKVNGNELTGASHRDAVQLLLQPGATLTLSVRHDPLPPGFQVSANTSRIWHRIRHLSYYIVLPFIISKSQIKSEFIDYLNCIYCFIMYIIIDGVFSNLFKTW